MSDRGALPGATARAVWRAVASGVVVLMGAASTARAQSTKMQASGSPGTLLISTATAGSAPNAASDATTSYTVQVKTASKITASLDAPMPPGVTLTVQLAAVSGATSMGPVTLSTTPQALVTGIIAGHPVSATISYQLSATTAAGVITAQTRNVMFSLQAMP